MGAILEAITFLILNCQNLTEGFWEHLIISINQI